MQEGLGQLGDFRRHGGRKEQGLPGERHQLADLLDVGNEAHVEHAIRLVDDEDLDPGEKQLAAFREVEEATRRGDQNVCAAGDLGFLIGERHAADQQGDVELVVDAIFAESLFDLGREFARRLEDQRAGHPGAGAAAFQPGQHGQRKGGGFPGSGLGYAQHVPPR